MQNGRSPSETGRFEIAVFLAELLVLSLRKCFFLFFRFYLFVCSLSVCVTFCLKNHGLLHTACICVFLWLYVKIIKQHCTDFSLILKKKKRQYISLCFALHRRFRSNNVKIWWCRMTIKPLVVPYFIFYIKLKFV